MFGNCDDEESEDVWVTRQRRLLLLQAQPEPGRGEPALNTFFARFHNWVFTIVFWQGFTRAKCMYCRKLSQT